MKTGRRARHYHRDTIGRFARKPWHWLRFWVIDEAPEEEQLVLTMQ